MSLNEKDGLWSFVNAVINCGKCMGESEAPYFACLLFPSRSKSRLVQARWALMKDKGEEALSLGNSRSPESYADNLAAGENPKDCKTRPPPRP